MELIAIDKEGQITVNMQQIMILSRDYKALLRVARAAKGVDDGRISQGYNAVPQLLLDELANTLKEIVHLLEKDDD